MQKATEPEMRAALVTQGIAREEAARWSAGKLLDEMFKAFLEPHLVQPTFVVDYPRALSPLAKPHRDDPTLTERFELFVGGRGDGQRVQRAERSRRPARPGSRTRYDSAPPGTTRRSYYDADYIRALEYGMPPAGGVGWASTGW